MDIQLRRVKPGQTPGTLSLLGYFLVLCALVGMVKTGIDTYEESKHAKWPTVLATLTQQTVRQARPKGRASASRYLWYIQGEVRYNVAGEALTSNLRSRITYSEREAARMRRWVSHHPPGTSLLVRYDPQYHNIVVPDGGDMPESGPQTSDDLKLVLIFLLPSIAFVAIGRALQRRGI